MSSLNIMLYVNLSVKRPVFEIDFILTSGIISKIVFGVKFRSSPVLFSVYVKLNPKVEFNASMLAFPQSSAQYILKPADATPGK
jgi:hypothetical protein